MFFDAFFSRAIESDGFVRTGEELSPRRRVRQRKTALPSHRQGKDTDDKIPVFIPFYIIKKLEMMRLSMKQLGMRLGEMVLV
uniref:hypothetical protein n=1 Tax=Dialister sp. TaxID=1955814 RepID=UPI0040268A39